MKLLKRLCLAFVLMLGGLSLASCNTLEGAGEDVEAGGEAVQDAAD